jgi:hypothetical protein
MKRKKLPTVKIAYEFIRLIGYGTIGAVAVFLFDQRLKVKEEIIQKKDEEIKHLSSLLPSNMFEQFESLKKLYEEELEVYKKRLKAAESGAGNEEQIALYKQKVLELETKLNLLTQVSDDFTKKVITKLGPPLKFDDLRPFAFFAVVDKEDPAVREFIAYIENRNYKFRIDSGPILSIPLTTLKKYPGTFITTGTHSPMYYSFDSVDLRTATFKRTDLRGVDLSDVMIDRNTKLPAIN